MTDDQQSPPRHIKPVPGWAALVAGAAGVVGIGGTVALNQCGTNNTPTTLSPGFTSKTNADKIAELNAQVDRYMRGMSYIDHGDKPIPEEFRGMQSTEEKIAARENLARDIAAQNDEVRNAVMEHLHDLIKEHDLNTQRTPEDLLETLKKNAKLINVPFEDGDEPGGSNDRYRQPAKKTTNMVDGKAVYIECRKGPAGYNEGFGFPVNYLQQLEASVILKRHTEAEKDAGLETAEEKAKRLDQAVRQYDIGQPPLIQSLKNDFDANLKNLLDAAMKLDKKAELEAQRDLITSALRMANKSPQEIWALHEIAEKLKTDRQVFNFGFDPANIDNNRKTLLGLPESAPNLTPAQVGRIRDAYDFATAVAEMTPNSPTKAMSAQPEGKAPARGR